MQSMQRQHQSQPIMRSHCGSTDMDKSRRKTGVQTVQESSQ